MANNDKTPVWPGWETVRLIGRGSFGAVYEIERKIRKTTERSAMKVITIPKENGEIKELSLKGYDRESITERFQTLKESIEEEYATMAKLKGCANVVYCDDIRSVQHDDGMGWDIYIRMELLTPLLEYGNGAMDEREIIRLGKEMCSALAVCQKHDIVHRDIKPQNIFVSNDGTFKLGDFGIAKAVEHTTSGTMTGTYDYMAPEVEKHLPYNRTVDIYSLGMVLYWYLNEKRLPFLPMPPAKIYWKDETSAKERRLRGDTLPEPAHGSGELKRIVLKACAYDPKDRYRSAEEMLRDLEALSTPDAPRRTTLPAEPPAPQPAAISPKKPEPTVGMFGDRSNPEPGSTERGTIEMFGGGSNAESDAPRRTTPPAESPAPKPAPIETEKPKPIERGTVGVFDRKFEPEEETPPAKKTPWGLIAGLAALVALLAVGFFTIHVWTPATCTEPETCKICGKTRGEALGHQWEEATYASPKTCRICGVTEDAPLEHTVSEIKFFFFEKELTEFTMHEGDEPLTIKAQVYPIEEFSDAKLTWSVDDESVFRLTPSEDTRECKCEILSRKEGGVKLSVACGGRKYSIPVYLLSASHELDLYTDDPMPDMRDEPLHDMRDDGRTNEEAKEHTVEIGSYVVFGSYEQDNNLENGTEDIEWLVLAQEGNRLLVVSRYALDCQPYNTKYKNVTWESCSLRSWLNETFLNAAFCDEEKAHIPIVTVSADKNPYYGTHPGNSTKDQVFLLSITEAYQYFASDEVRKCVPSEYAIAQGYYERQEYYESNSTGTFRWWLRSPGGEAYHASYVGTDGSVLAYGSIVPGDHAVRPALWIELGS